MKIKPNRQAGLSLVGAIIAFGFIMLIGYLLLRILLKILEQNPLPDPRTGERDTNIVTVVSSSLYHSTPAAIEMPGFEFDPAELGALDAESFVENGTLLIERSTNLVDWLPAWRISAMSEFNMTADTNPPAPAAFYRAVLIP